MPAVPVHHTATSDGSWDGPTAVAELAGDAGPADFAKEFAWKPGSADEQNNKSDWKFPHHTVSGGKPGNAVQAACSAVVAALNGGRGGAAIPDADRRGVYNHVIAHLKDAGVAEQDLPELKGPRRPHTVRRMLDPGFERRRERRAGMRGRTERYSLPFTRGGVELRAKPSGTAGACMYEFSGYAAVYDAPFEMWDWWGEPYLEVVNQGACTRTLAGSPDVPFLIGHDDGGIALARTKSGTLRLSQDDHGLYTRVPELDGASPLVQSLVSAIDRGDMDEMSLAFVCRQQQWSPDYEQRNVLEMDIHRGDVSIVCLGANPATAGAGVNPAVIPLSARRPAASVRMPTQPYTRGPDEAVTCPQCASGNDNDACYCDQCGTALAATAAYVRRPEDTQMCEPCGCWQAPDAKVCDQCGASLVNDHDADDGYSDWWASRRPGERRAADEVMDTSTAPDYNPGPHNADTSLRCPNPGCDVDGGALNSQDAKWCDQCGAPLYNEDGLIVLDDSGVVEEVEGAMADADLLSLQRAQLEVLRRRGTERAPAV